MRRPFRLRPDYPAVLGPLRGRVDVVVVFGDVSILAARQIQDVTPIVFVNASDPVSLGVVQSLARPGGNMTGVALISTEVAGKRLEFLKQILPRMSRVAVLLNPNNPAAALDLRAVETVGRALGVAVKRFDVAAPGDVEDVIARIAQEGWAGVVVGSDAMLATHRERLVESMARHRLPASYATGEFVQIGGLLAYGANLKHLAARAAGYVRPSA